MSKAKRFLSILVTLMMVFSNVVTSFEPAYASASRLENKLGTRLRAENIVVPDEGTDESSEEGTDGGGGFTL